MAICSHHYPVEGCHNCWEWLEEWKDDLRRENILHEALLTKLVAVGAVTLDSIDAVGEELAGVEHPARFLVDIHREMLQFLAERDRARRAARRLYHDWSARTVRSLREMAEADPWILERIESAAAAAVPAGTVRGPQAALTEEPDGERYAQDVAVELARCLNNYIEGCECCVTQEIGSSCDLRRLSNRTNSWRAERIKAGRLRPNEPLDGLETAAAALTEEPAG